VGGELIRLRLVGELGASFSCDFHWFCRADCQTGFAWGMSFFVAVFPVIGALGDGESYVATGKCPVEILILKRLFTFGFAHFSVSH